MMHSATKETLSPGDTLEFTFPDLPETFHSTVTGTPVVPTMAARLPDSYDSSKAYPVFVFIRGADGGNGQHLTRPLSIIGDQDYIAVNMPLFKKQYDPEQTMALLLGAEDVSINNAAYEQMLAKLEEAIPNIDFTRSIFGGFSNGAHITSFMLSTQAPCLCDRFRNFLLLEGGLYLSGLQYPFFHDANVLLLVGAGSSNAEPWRPPLLKMSEALEALAKHYAVNLTRVLMDDTGHSFPDRFIPIVRDWMKTL